MKAIKLDKALVVVLPIDYLNRFDIVKGIPFDYVINDDGSLTIKPKVV